MIGEFVTPEVIAKRMFERNAAEYTTDQSQLEQLWHEDPGVKAFWLAQAIPVIEDVQRMCMVCHPDLRTRACADGLCKFADERCANAGECFSCHTDTRASAELPGQLTIEDVPDA